MEFLLICIPGIVIFSFILYYYQVLPQQLLEQLPPPLFSSLSLFKENKLKTGETLSPSTQTLSPPLPKKFKRENLNMYNDYDGDGDGDNDNDTNNNVDKESGRHVKKNKSAISTDYDDDDYNLGSISVQPDNLYYYSNNINDDNASVNDDHENMQSLENVTVGGSGGGDGGSGGSSGTTIAANATTAAAPAVIENNTEIRLVYNDSANNNNILSGDTIPTIRIINSFYEVGATQQLEEDEALTIKITNDFRICFENIENFDNWKMSLTYDHLHYKLPESNDSSLIIYYACLSVTNPNNLSFIFIMVKNILHFSEQLGNIVGLCWQSKFNQKNLNIQYIYIQFIDTPVSQIRLFRDNLRQITSNLFTIVFDSKLQVLRIFPFNIVAKKENPYSFIVSLKERKTYQGRFLFYSEAEFDNEDYIETIREYFIKTDFFGVCNCYQNKQQTDPDLIYGKVIPPDTADDKEVVIENVDKQIKIINVNNRNSLGSTFKNIIYRYVTK